MPDQENKEFLRKMEELEGAFMSEELEPVLQRCGGATLLFLEEVIERGFVSKERACRLWADAINMAYVNPLIAVVTQDAVQRLPFDIARKSQSIGLYVINNVLTVAMSRPGDTRLLRQLEAIANIKVSPVFAPPREIEHAIDPERLDLRRQNGIDGNGGVLRNDDASALTWYLRALPCCRVGPKPRAGCGMRRLRQRNQRHRGHDRLCHGMGRHHRCRCCHRCHPRLLLILREPQGWRRHTGAWLTDR